MKKITNLAQIFILFISLLMLGCTRNNVYEIDNDEHNVTERIIGIKELYDAGAKSVNVVFIHGMGYHPIEEEVEEEKGVTRLYQNRLAKELGFNIEQHMPAYKKAKPIMLKQSKKITGGSLHWRKFKNKKDQTLNLFALSWDESTVAIQKSMFELDKKFYESNGSKDREKDRACINSELKRFINRSFADPAIYLGSFGKEIRYVVTKGIDEIDAISRENNYANDPKLNPIVHISDSLGSSVIFDTVKESMAIVDKSSEEFKYKESVKRFAGRTTLIFMNANQLPLIELGRITGPTEENETEDQWLDNYPCSDSSELGGLLGFNETRKQYIKEYYRIQRITGKPIDELEVVAFTDPNDPLSYYLTERFKKHCNGKKSKGDKEINIVNVMLTNAKLNYLFLLANPVEAHASGFKDNTKAIDIVVNGVKP